MIGCPPKFLKSERGYGRRRDARKGRGKKIRHVMERLNRQRKDLESLEGLTIQRDGLKEIQCAEKKSTKRNHTTELNSSLDMTSV